MNSNPHSAMLSVCYTHLLHVSLIVGVHCGCITVCVRLKTMYVWWQPGVCCFKGMTCCLLPKCWNFGHVRHLVYCPILFTCIHRQPHFDWHNLSLHTPNLYCNLLDLHWRQYIVNGSQDYCFELLLQTFPKTDWRQLPLGLLLCNESYYMNPLMIMFPDEP